MNPDDILPVFREDLPEVRVLSEDLLEFLSEDPLEVLTEDPLMLKEIVQTERKHL